MRRSNFMMFALAAAALAGSSCAKREDAIVIDDCGDDIEIPSRRPMKPQVPAPMPESPSRQVRRAAERAARKGRKT